MADTKITNDASSNQVRYSNPATHPLPVSAGQSITVSAGGSSNAVHGQILTGGTIFGPVFDNPGR